MKHKRIFQAWDQILLGRKPASAIELTDKCPLSCPGCYAYQPNHVSGNSLESVSEFRGDELVERALGLLDARRTPATYERILRNIDGCRVHIHCTITRQMTEDPVSIELFLSSWSAMEEVQGIRVSLYTPQLGESSAEILTPEQRFLAISELDRLGKTFEKLRHSDDMITAYLNPPENPAECIFAHVTDCISSDLRTPVAPCQLGRARLQSVWLCSRRWHTGGRCLASARRNTGQHCLSSIRLDRPSSSESAATVFSKWELKPAKTFLNLPRVKL